MQVRQSLKYGYCVMLTPEESDVFQHELDHVPFEFKKDFTDYLLDLLEVEFSRIKTRYDL